MCSASLLLRQTAEPSQDRGGKLVDYCTTYLILILLLYPQRGTSSLRTCLRCLLACCRLWQLSPIFVILTCCCVDRARCILAFIVCDTRMQTSVKFWHSVLDHLGISFVLSVKLNAGWITRSSGTENIRLFISMSNIMFLFLRLL